MWYFAGPSPVSDQPSWGRRGECCVRGSVTQLFQTNPRGVGGIAPSTSPITAIEFQTNPRGVGGCMISSNRVTYRRVSDQPSWGRRCNGLPATSAASPFQTNPRGVGGDHRVATSASVVGFRPTLVGSEGSNWSHLPLGRNVSDQPSWGRRDHYQDWEKALIVSDQPSWGRRVHCYITTNGLPLFQTNPRGVGGSQPQNNCGASCVSDQPSWGRRMNSRRGYNTVSHVSDQPS